MHGTTMKIIHIVVFWDVTYWPTDENGKSKSKEKNLNSSPRKS